MANWKVQMAPRYGALSVGDNFQGYSVVETTPGGAQAIVALPDHWTEAQVTALMADWERRGVIEDDGRGLFRREYTDYRPVGAFLGRGETITTGAPALDVRLLGAPGDTFGLLGITEAVRGRGKWGAGALIGVCDTGVDGSHPWFHGKALAGDLRDDHSHGTHVSGTCAGAHGIASDAALYVRNVLPGGQGSESGIAAGIRACADRGCTVLNLSLGGQPSQILDDACNYAKARGCVVVVAAGNGGGAPIGSPARAADLIVLAMDRSRQYASFTDGRGWSNPNRVVAPGVDIVSSGPGGGTFPSSGTSMAAPHITGAVALLRAAGLDRATAIGYILGHRGAAPDGLACTLAADFGEGAGEEPMPPDELAQVREEFRQAIVLLDDARFHNREANPDFAWTEVGEASRILAIASERLGKVEPAPEPPPSEPPPPARIQSVYGTYNGHGLAIDAYPGRTDDEVQWGPHHGIPLVAPVDGRVEVYQFGTPLNMAMSAIHSVLADPAGYVANWHALSDGWTCRATPQQTMYVAVFYPSDYFEVGGQRIGHLHYGHVRGDIRTGPVRQGDVFAYVYDSGIRFEPQVPNARAAHVHCCAGAGTQLSPNGDLPGRLAVFAQGWQATDAGFMPGPSEYQSGAWCAGRRLSDFTRSGRPVPPMPR